MAHPVGRDSRGGRDDAADDPGDDDDDAQAPSVKPPVYIDTDKALEQLVRRLSSHAAIAVDTESNPLFAYRERLCLVQISTRTRDYLVDPVAGVDVGLLSGVFADPAITKVFHDAEFDLLMLKRTRPFEFSSIFDTKVVASSLGLPRVGLASMLDDYFGVTLDKRYQRSDWGRRPLTEGQIAYAAQDTHYLLRMMAELRRLLHAAGEPAVLEVAAECRRVCLLQPEPKRFEADEFTKIKGADRLDPDGRRALRELYVMRHRLARRRDCPAFKILANEMLLQLAAARPMDREALARVRPVSPKLARRYGDQILSTLRRASGMSGIEKMPRVSAEPSEALRPDERELYEALRSWRKRIAQARPTEASLVLSRGCMLQLARLRRKPRSVEELAATELLEPWRVRLHGDDLLSILEAF